jgi:hypothetical protein
MATLQDAIETANPNNIASAIQALSAGGGITFGQWLKLLATGGLTETIDITATPAVTITLANPAQSIYSVNVLTAAGGQEDVCAKIVLPTAATSLLVASVAGPIAGTLTALGSVTLSADGLTITFEKQVKSVTVRYMPRLTVDGQAAFDTY